MNIKQLKELVKDLPDNTPVLTGASDHSYRQVSGEVTTALYGGGVWSEDYGEETTPEKEYGKRKTVLILN